ncbi:MAG: hypothetical protein RLY86_1008 [Pseudomonadota bacterium]|jgi:hypothetical protein
MPIRRQHRYLYPIDWQQISRRIRFDRAKGRCEACGRPHGLRIAQLPDGRWQDPQTGEWRDDQGSPTTPPDLVERVAAERKQVKLAACHRSHEPWRVEEGDLAAWCGRCHLRHDRDEHRRQRRITWLKRRALGDLFLGRYPIP